MNDHKIKYTVSLHRAIRTAEVLALARRFDKVQFDRNWTTKSWDGFFSHSPLVDDNEFQLSQGSNDLDTY